MQRPERDNQTPGANERLARMAANDPSNSPDQSHGRLTEM